MEDFNSKYSGEQVEALLDQVASGNAGGGGGGGITVETDPVFSASPAASITEEQIRTWDDTHEFVEDINEDISKLYNALDGKQDTLVSGENIKTINGESIVGSGDITIAGGSGEKGEKGEKGDKGDTGVGVQSIAQTTTSNADGGSNVVTVTLTDGTKSTFTVKNGSKGSQGIQGEQGPKGDTGANGTNGKDGADGATFTPSVDAAGNLSWSNDKGLVNPPTVNIKGPKGDKGDAGEGGGDSSGGGEGGIQWTMRNAEDYIDNNGVIELDPFVVYYNGYFSGNATILFNGDDDYSEWRIIFYIGAGNSLTINVDCWANGITPNISAGGMYELSVVSNAGGFYGVIAHFPI